jgi:hypothetical protein
MKSNLGKFLQGFSDQNNTKESEVVKPCIDKVNEEIIVKSKENNEKELIRPVERIKRREPEKIIKEAEVKINETKPKSLKLNIKKVEKVPIPGTPIESNSVKSIEVTENKNQINTISKTEEILEDIDVLFAKTNTPMDQKEKWILTIQKARQSNAKTMFNTKVCTGRFRFTSIGELEILPDMDTYGKSSKEILSIKWDKK